MGRRTSRKVEALVLEHRSLARKVASRWFPHAHCEADRKDLISAAYEGLILAAKAYDGRRNFPRFAKERMAGAVKDHLRVLDPMSRDMRGHRNRLGRAGADLRQILGRAPLIEELAAHMGLTVAEVERLRVKAMRPEFLEIDRPITTAKGTEVTYADVLPATGPKPDDVVRARLDAFEATVGLDDRLLFVLRERFVKDRSLKAIGADLGVTESRACQLVATALRVIAEDLAAA